MLIPTGEMLILLGLLTSELLTLPVFYARFASHRGNVDNVDDVEISFLKSA